jgi:molecular chaperone DnaK
MSAYMQFGIDLGTTNSCVGCCEGQGVRIFQNNDLMNVTPSVVRLRKNGQIIVGKKAYNAVVDDPANVAAEFKRWMGQKDKKLFPAAGREMTAEELSAEVLKSLREDVRRATGNAMTASVITVPAAFGTLQCEATARAARLAGIEQCSLLQEPIAAAIAYGARPGTRDERWLVYDLGGGTLDIAVASTRDGRLTVIEHRGDNLLGGKDIDRALVETYLLPALQKNFKLPDKDAQPEQYQILLRRLTMKAEEAKIELSTTPKVTVSLFDIGEDLDGKEIELELPLTVDELIRVFEPIMQRTLKLADEALAGARIEGKDLSRILLVGGPTQMEYLRNALGEHLKAPVDFTLDPMTVVARGAALFAATVETNEPAVKATPGTTTIKLAYEPVSGSLETLVAGRIENAGAAKLEVRIESQAGYWTSGWTPMTDGYFEMNVMLQEAKICPFFLYVREARGKALNIEPNEFIIRHGLEPSAPPLPHSISVEVVRPNGRIELDPIFPRNTPLPAEKRIHYRADHTLRPGAADTAITVKLWEGEELSEPEANEWVGNVHIKSSMVRRPIPEDSEIELFIQIDRSRLITVEIFVPHLNQHFADGVYLAEQEQQDEKDAAAKLTKEIEGFTDRLALLHDHLENHGGAGDAAQALATLRQRVEDLDIEVTSSIQQNTLSDLERVRRLASKARDLRTQISALEHRIGVDRLLTERSRQAGAVIREVEDTVKKYGDKLVAYEFEMVRKQLEHAAERLDERGVNKCIEDLSALNLRILSNQDWFWRDIFDSMDKSDTAFVNPKQAQHWVLEGERAIREGKGDALRVAVRKLWDLQPRDKREASLEKARRTGLRS